MTKTKKPEKNVGGRPKIEDATVLTPEMDDYAQLMARGHTVQEIATTMHMTADRASKFANAAIVQERVKTLQGDLDEKINDLEGKLEFLLLEDFIEKLRKNELNVADKKWVLERIWKVKGKLTDAKSKSGGTTKKQISKKLESKKPVFESKVVDE